MKSDCRFDGSAAQQVGQARSIASRASPIGHSTKSSESDSHSRRKAARRASPRAAWRQPPRHPELEAAASQTYDTLRTAVMRVAPHASKGSQELERLTLRCWAMVHGLASLRIDRLIESGSDEGFVELADDLLDRVTQDYPAVAPTPARRSGK